MGLPHQNLTLAVGAAKEKARAIMLPFGRRRAVPTGQSNAVYLALIVLHRDLLDAYPYPVTHFIPDLEHLARECNGELAPVKALIEAALRFAREGHGTP